MVKREKRKHRKHSNKNIYIYSFFAIMIGIIILSAIYQTQFSQTEKLSAEDYFEIRDAIVIDADWERSTSDVLFITQISFNITAVGGDAHSVIVSTPGMISEEDWPIFSELKQDETQNVVIPPFYPSSYAVRSIMTSEGDYPLRIRIDSEEASGYITILF